MRPSVPLAAAPSGVAGVNVDATPGRALVVGTESARNQVVADPSAGAPATVLDSLPLAGPGALTGVAALRDRAVVAGSGGGVFALSTP